eukprot:g771.t1
MVNESTSTSRSFLHVIDWVLALSLRERSRSQVARPDRPVEVWRAHSCRVAGATRVDLPAVFFYAAWSLGMGYVQYVLDEIQSGRYEI